MISKLVYMGAVEQNVGLYLCNKCGEQVLMDEDIVDNELIGMCLPCNKEHIKLINKLERKVATINRHISQLGVSKAEIEQQIINESK